MFKFKECYYERQDQDQKCSAWKGLRFEKKCNKTFVQF